LETRIKRGFPHSHSDGDGGLPSRYKAPTPRKIGASYRFLHRTVKGMVNASGECLGNVRADSVQIVFGAPGTEGVKFGVSL